MTKGFKIPTGASNPKGTIALPNNGVITSEKGFSFSFSCFDRTNSLFNLGGNADDGTVGGSWFIDLIECFKSVNSKTISELIGSIHDYHPVDWSSANVSAPPDSDQLEYHQFRINKSKGRVIGFLIDGVFYVVWLDPHHNLTDSPHYPGATKYRAPFSQYESQQNTIKDLTERVKYLENELAAAEDLLGKK